MKRGASSPLMVVVVLAVLAMSCSSGSGLVGSPVGRTEVETTVASSNTSPTMPQSTTQRPPTNERSTSEPSTSEPRLDPGPDGGPVIATVEEAEVLLDRTAVESDDPPPDLVAAIDEVLRNFIAGDLVDEEFFEDMDQLTPIGLLGESYLICDVESLGPFCVATEADYLDWVAACHAIGGVLVERLVTEGPGWAGTGFCLWQDEPDLMARGAARSGFA